MCLIILKTYEGKILKNDLKNAFKNNPDGVGFCYTDFNKLHVYKKVYKTFKEFYNDYEIFKDVSEGYASNLLIHFRFATHGLIDDNSCHPFYINDNLAVAHNGVIQTDREDDNLSDTQIYIEDTLKQLPKDFHRNNAILKLIADNIGHYNKLAFLDKDNIYKIVNEDQGQWYNGCWYSYPIRYEYKSDYNRELAQYYESLYTNGGF